VTDLGGDPPAPAHQRTVGDDAAADPVPTVTATRSPPSSSARPAPKTNSPQAAALASLSTVVGSPERASISSRGAGRAGDVGREEHDAVPEVDEPGGGDATACTSNPRRHSSMTEAISATRAAGFSAVESSRARACTWPCASTTPAAILVPPTSTPTVSVIARSRTSAVVVLDGNVLHHDPLGLSAGVALTLAVGVGAETGGQQPDRGGHRGDASARCE